MVNLMSFEATENFCRFGMRAFRSPATKSLSTELHCWDNIPNDSGEKNSESHVAMYTHPYLILGVHLSLNQTWSFMEDTE